MEVHLYPCNEGAGPKRGVSMVSQNVGLILMIGDGIRSIARAAILWASTVAHTDKTNARFEAGCTSAAGLAGIGERPLCGSPVHFQSGAARELRFRALSRS